MLTHISGQNVTAGHSCRARISTVTFPSDTCPSKGLFYNIEENQVGQGHNFICAVVQKHNDRVVICSFYFKSSFVCVNFCFFISVWKCLNHFVYIPMTVFLFVFLMLIIYVLQHPMFFIYVLIEFVFCVKQKLTLRHQVYTSLQGPQKGVACFTEHVI